MVGSKSLSRSVFLEVSQEPVPGGIPGVCPGTQNLKNENTNFETLLSGGRCEITDISHRPWGTV